MSLFNTLNTGASGLGVSTLNLSVIGDNIANIGTTAFKAGRASFTDFMPNDTMSIGGKVQVGSGSTVATVATLFGQGTLESTSSATDLAINGNGFFAVSSGSETFYTRAGEFYMDADGYLVTAAGLNLQGYNATAGTLLNSISDLRIDTSTSSPSATTSVELMANLSSETEYDDTPIGDGTYDLSGTGDTLEDVAADADFTTSVTVYDSLGQAHVVSILFERTGVGDWSWYAVVDGAEVGLDEDAAFQVASGTLEFDGDGELIGFTQVDTSSTTAWSFEGADAGDLEFCFGWDGTEDTSGSLTMTGTDSATSTVSQDGFPPGELTGLTVDTDGVITGTYSNGEESNLGQVVLASFTSLAGLEQMGSSLYRANVNSGEASLGAAGTGGRGTLTSYALEASNVSLEDEFVSMIQAQRSYQASARVISTANDTLRELVNLV